MYINLCNQQIILTLIYLFVKHCKSSVASVDFSVDYVSAMVGHKAKLHCSLTESESTGALVLWLKNNHSLPIYSLDRRDPNDPSENSRWGSKIRFDPDNGVLTIFHVTPEEAGLYNCEVTTRDSPTRKIYTHLEVIVPPGNVSIMHKQVKVNEKIIGPFKEGESLTLNCVSFGGSPLPELTWYRGYDIIDTVSIKLSDRRIRNDLVIPQLRRADYGARFRCEARNNNITKPVRATVTINMLLGPQLISLYTSEEVSHEGGRRWFVCRLVGAHPVPEVVWFKDRLQIQAVEQDYTEEKNGSLVSSTMSMEMTRSDHGSNFVCCAPSHNTQINFTCSKPITVRVYYPPSLVLSVNGEVLNEANILLGENVTLQCDIEANPLITDFMWYRNEVLVSSEARHEDTTQILEASEAGSYKCVAANEEGVTESSVLLLNVTYAPKCVDELPVEMGVDLKNYVNITCNVTSEPAPSLFKWYLRNDTETTAIAATPDSTISYEVYEASEYGTIVCVAENAIGVGDECLTIVTSRAPPRAPVGCQLRRLTEPPRIHLSCPRQNIGRVQKYILSVISTETVEEIQSVSGPQANMTIEEPQDVTSYQLNLTAVNEEGSSPTLVFLSDEILEDDPDSGHVVADVSQLVLWLALAVLGISACACAIAICAREPSRQTNIADTYSDDAATSDTSHVSDAGESEVTTLRRTDSFRKAIRAKQQQKRTDLYRTNSFRTPVCLGDEKKYHSLRNVRAASKSEAPLCDRLLEQIRDDFPNYSIPKPPEPFYTMPRRMTRNAIIDDTSLNSHNVDGLSLPPPPEEFQTLTRGRISQTQEDIISDPNNPFCVSSSSGIYGVIEPSCEQSGRNTGSTFKTPSLQIAKFGSTFGNRF